MAWSAAPRRRLVSQRQTSRSNRQRRERHLFYISFFSPARLRAQVAASTLHSLFDLGANNESKLDFTKRHEKVLALLRTAILLLDEVSMIDCDIFEALAKQLGIADHTRRGTDAGADEYGEVHLVLFGDMKQLPPATSELGRR